MTEPISRRLAWARDEMAVVAPFGQFVVRHGDVDPSTGRILRDLFDLGNAADYDVDNPPANDLGGPAARARAFVDAFAEWLGH